MEGGTSIVWIHMDLLFLPVAIVARVTLLLLRVWNEKNDLIPLEHFRVILVLNHFEGL